MVVHFRHAKSAGLEYCSRGMRLFFARHGLSYGAFLREGIPAEQLLATGDAMARRVVDVAAAEAAAGDKTGA
nr:hypothetical protein [Rubrivivax gelatinosus]